MPNAKSQIPTIVVALTDDYLHKAQPLFQSLKKNAPNLRKCVLVIVKNPPNIKATPSVLSLMDTFEVMYIRLDELTSYRPGWPKNRPFYACAEGGEFLQYFDFADDEVIIHIDADFVMQRMMTPRELMIFSNVKHDIIYADVHSHPPTTLREEFWKLLPCHGYVRAKKMLPGNWNYPMFCAGFVCCTAATYRKVSEMYLSRVDFMTYEFAHHAAGQWIMNYVVRNIAGFYVQMMDHTIHHASWYLDSPCEEKIVNGLPKLFYKGTPVLFNHTKFIKEYGI